MNLSTSPPPPPTQRRWPRRAMMIVAAAYLAVLVGVAVVLRWADDWWLATIVMFSPRCAFALPLIVLAPVALYFRSGILLTILAGIVAAWPVSGFNIPWGQMTASTPAGTRLRIMTCNMHATKADPILMEELIASSEVDVVAVQEWLGQKRAVLKDMPGWQTHKTPGGRQFLASRYPIRQTVELGHDSMGEHASARRYDLDTPAGTVHVISLHLATIRAGIADTIHEADGGPDQVGANSVRRREQSEYVAQHASDCKGPVVIVGDFNTPPESPLFGDVWEGYTDAFTATGWGWGYTFIGSKTMVRIDHVLAGAGWTVTGCRVGPNVGSPHRPVIADLVWPEGEPIFREK